MSPSDESSAAISLADDSSSDSSTNHGEVNSTKRSPIDVALLTKMAALQTIQLIRGRISKEKLSAVHDKVENDNCALDANDLLVLLKSRGKQTRCKRVRQLTKEWETVKTMPEAWEAEWFAIEEEMENLRRLVDK